MSTFIAKSKGGKPGEIESAPIKSGVALMKWRRERGISRKVFAQIADCSERKLATYEKAPTLPAKVRRPVAESVRIVQALRELAGEGEALNDWLNRPNPAFDRKTPLSLIVSGKSDVLWQMAHQIREGAFA